MVSTLKVKNKVIPDYTRKDVEQALLKVGLRNADTVFSHSNLGYFGIPEGGLSEENIRKIILEPILEIIGPQGTFVVPTFSYSFNKGDIFDPAQTVSVCGVLTEIVRKYPGSYRSHDPIFSVAAIGARAKELTQGVSNECFGRDSFWERFYKHDGVILNMNFGVPVTMFHYFEKLLNVSYRYDKLFKAKILKDGVVAERPAIYFCRDMTNDLTRPDWLGIDALAKERKLSRSTELGRGYITSIGSRVFFGLISEKLKDEPFFMTTAANAKTIPQISRKRQEFDLKISGKTGLKDISGLLNGIPRDLVSDGYDACLEILARALPLNIYEYPTGTHCAEWIIPEKWACFEASLETLSGKKILSYVKDPGCVASYSQPFEAEVPREELVKHLWADDKNPDLVPAKFLYYDRDWGFCCSRKTKEGLKENSYKVSIKSDFSFGALKIAEAVIKGKKKESIILCCHLGDKKVARDGIRSIMAGLDYFQKAKSAEYTYRLVIVPQDFTFDIFLNDKYKNSLPVKDVQFIGEE